VQVSPLFIVRDVEYTMRNTPAALLLVTLVALK
jgi:hypothetical protein